MLVIKFDERALLGCIQVLQVCSISKCPRFEAFTHGLFVQVGSLQNAAHEDVRYKNTIDGLRTIVCNQGWKQLFHGVSINYIRVMLTLP